MIRSHAWVRRWPEAGWVGGDVAVGCRVWRQTCRKGKVGVAEPCIGAAVHTLQQCEGWLVATQWQR